MRRISKKKRRHDRAQADVRRPLHTGAVGSCVSSGRMATSNRDKRLALLRGIGSDPWAVRAACCLECSDCPAPPGKDKPMKIKSERDFWSGLLFVATGIGFAWGALNYSFGSSARPGPAYFPFGLGVLTALLGALLLFTSLAVETEHGDKIGDWPLKQLAWILGAVVVFGFALPRLGMSVALPLLIIISSFASGEFRWKEVLINSFVLTIASWAIFIKGLGLIIPLWPVYITG
jgi:hypothetical protein